MDLENDFISFAASLLGVDSSMISPQTSMGDIPQWDSVMHLRLVMETEAKYGFSFSMEKVLETTSISSFVALIKENMK